MLQYHVIFRQHKTILTAHIKVLKDIYIPFYFVHHTVIHSCPLCQRRSVAKKKS